MFVARGSDPATATQQSYAVVWGAVQRQAAMISYIGVFRLLAVMFLLAIPFVALLRKPAHQSGPAIPAGE